MPPCPTSLDKQDQLQPVSQSCVQLALEFLHGEKPHNLSVQPVPVFGHFQSKEVFPDTNRTSMCLGLCSFPLVLTLGTTEESLALSALHPPLRYLYTLIRFSRLSGPISPSLFSEERCSSCFITFVTLCWTSSTVCPCLSCTGEAVGWTQHSRNPSALLSSREASLPLTCWPGSASCRPGGCCPYLPQCHIIREKASYYYGINTDTHLFLELNRRYLKLKF